jgi:hypothetical protein
VVGGWGHADFEQPDLEGSGVKGLEKVGSKELKTALMKSETVIFRVTAAEKQSIKSTATSLGMSVSHYLTALHAFAHTRLKPRKNK